MEPSLSNARRGKPKYAGEKKKNLSQGHFVYHKSHMPRLGANPGPQGEWGATESQCHITALKNFVSVIFCIL